MQPRFKIAVVLCFTATLLAAAACTALPKRESTGAATLLAQNTGRTQETPEGQPEEIERLERAAVFRDSGRYYK
jgi:hypothetical protein